VAKVEFTLTGCANGYPVRIEGMGTATARDVRIALKAREVPFTFDVGLAWFAGLDVVVALAAGLASAADGAVVGRLRADLVGEGGVDVGTVALVATVERVGVGYRCTAQFAEARVALEVGERITAVESRTITAAPLAGAVALLSATTASTSRGRELAVLTTAALIGAEAGSRSSVTARSTTLSRGAVVVRFDAS
jgi:hypothetical protein